MALITRGFTGRPRDRSVGDRLPPGQYLVKDFPVLSTGPTPHLSRSEWTFSITGEVDEEKHWTWEEFRKLPSETITKDIHCVTKWSKLDTTWEGVSLDTLLAEVDSAADYAMAFCEGGYTTNIPLDDLTGGQAWLAFATTVRRSNPSTEVRPVCWCRICISGRAPSGCAGCSS
jgi:DMSO/TMAO reductase YedYZ molybdopterin-dependent catalytic subunit